MSPSSFTHKKGIKKNSTTLKALNNKKQKEET